jgi:hypothetical protein
MMDHGLLVLDRRRRAFSGADDEYIRNNDELDINAYDKDRIEIRNGYPVRYKCLDIRLNLGEGEQVVANLMIVKFNYEVVMLKDSDFGANMRALEWSILWILVQILGLNRCDLTKQRDALEEAKSFMIQQEGDGNRFRSLTTNFDILNSTSSYVLFAFQ